MFTVPHFGWNPFLLFFSAVSASWKAFRRRLCWELLKSLKRRAGIDWIHFRTTLNNYWCFWSVNNLSRQKNFMSDLSSIIISMEWALNFWIWKHNLPPFQCDHKTTDIKRVICLINDTRQEKLHETAWLERWSSDQSRQRALNTSVHDLACFLSHACVACISVPIICHSRQ